MRETELARAAMSAHPVTHSDHSHPHVHAHHDHIHIAPPAPPVPHRLRLALVLMLCVYPVITTLLYVLVPLTEGWATWHRTLLITPVMVFAIIFVVTPLILRYLHWLVIPRRRLP
jgi:antibiotic biosynthesis monooxygenase (ABM) superfamily enzyme